MHIIFSARNIVCGFLSWLLPFAASIPFFGRNGQLAIPQPLFKSLMVVIGGGIGIWLLLFAFRGLRLTASRGLAVGIFWLAINIALDAAVLLPMSGMGFLPYLEDIGLRYLLLPMIAAGLGIQAQRTRGDVT